MKLWKEVGQEEGFQRVLLMMKNKNSLLKMFPSIEKTQTMHQLDLQWPLHLKKMIIFHLAIILAHAGIYI
jgi:hypothetical protein